MPVNGNSLREQVRDTQLQRISNSELATGRGNGKAPRRTTIRKRCERRNETTLEKGAKL